MGISSRDSRSRAHLSLSPRGRGEGERSDHYLWVLDLEGSCVTEGRDGE